MICKTSSAYAKWAPTSWPIKPAAIAASVGLHALVFAGAGWLVSHVQHKNTPAKRLNVALVPAHLSTTQVKQHHIKRTKPAPAVSNSKQTNDATPKPPPIMQTTANRQASPEAKQSFAQKTPPQPPQQIASEITPATPVRLSAQYAASNRKPIYPTLSRRLGEEGTVVLRVFVTTEGMAGKIKIEQSSGHPLLDDSAMDAVRSWHFQPATANNRPISEWYQLPIPFKLLDKS